MINDKQALVLTGLMVGGIFVFGVLKALDNFVVLTVLTIIFFTIVLSIFSNRWKKKNKE
ncbi:hypothetical protein [Algibacter pectinivorans]|uniref:Uncharacterized protein n=1 Tax=Algibacter pectinivorans TaxID=870482 RepID=A0A1I1QVR5_9FLAO|nr:hypothetical protein [Algibacter pectinivorans]SFD26125.1 hypothetical protein SAMN04487987_107217 [Algibacter pectinivorans]